MIKSKEFKLSSYVLQYMSTNVKVNESPNHFMTLDAVARGINDINKIAKVTKLHKSDVELIVNDLANQRLITRAEKRGFFGNKKVRLSITEIGIRLLNAKKQELEQKMREVQQWYNNGDRSQIQDFMDSNRMWMPMMLFSGIMNIIFFTSMMSMMGMAMSPMESQMTGTDSGSTTDGSEGNNQEGGSDVGSNGNEGDVVDTSGDFGGFDGGGFGDF
jgi:DNA-binding MarR family transcriptional regulator